MGYESYLKVIMDRLTQTMTLVATPLRGQYLATKVVVSTVALFHKNNSHRKVSSVVAKCRLPAKFTG